MGLPTSNSEWPPRPHNQVIGVCRERQVWWEGDPQLLAAFYGGQQRSPGGVVNGGRFKRAWEAFWGRIPSNSEPNRVHVPLAADLGRVSAATLFSEPPTFTVPDEGDEGGQDRLDLIFNTPDNHSRLLVAGESASMLSGTYGRVVFDSDLADHAWIDFVDADRAIPTFRWGRLAEVTFWSVLPTDDERTVWRHIEHHSPGRIDHALYKGTATNLGKELPLTEHRDVAAVTPVFLTGVKGLTAQYFPNHRPAPEFRGIPQLEPLGRSDLTADVLHLLDAADEVWSSWMNDLRIGRGRLVVSEELLKRNGPGFGAEFDLDRSIFAPIGTATQAGDETSILEAHQFAIRVDEHQRTFEQLLRRIVSRAGYSPITFGLQDEVAVTATEVEAKEKDTNATRQAKIRLWSPLGDLAQACLAVDAQVFKTGVSDVEVEVEFPPMHQQSERQRSETVAMWEQAQAASTETKVKYLHPDWDDERVQTEVDAIMGETAPPVSIMGPGEGDFPDLADADVVEQPPTDAPIPPDQPVK